MKTQEYPVITLRGMHYYVDIMDSMHCRVRDVESERWGTAYHITQLSPDLETQIFEAGRIDNGHFTL